MEIIALTNHTKHHVIKWDWSPWIVSAMSKALNYSETMESRSSSRTGSISRIHEYTFVFLICICPILAQGGLAQTINPVTEIGETFDLVGNGGRLAWFSASYSLTMGTFILVAGRLGDLHGHKFLLLIGYIVWAAWSLVAGFAAFSKSEVFFDISRAFQGLGPAICMPNAVALIGVYFPNTPRKEFYLASFGAVTPLGFVLGALFSGIFAQLVWWPWMFWVNGILCFIVAISTYLVVPLSIGTKAPGSLDWIGSVTSVAGLVLIKIAFNQAPNASWQEPYIYIIFIIGLLFMVIFAWSSYAVSEPLVPLECWKGENGFVLGVVAAGWSSFGIWLYFTFRWAELVQGTPPILRAVQLMPAPIFGFVATGVAIFLLRCTPVLLVMLLSMISFLVGTILMGTRPISQTYWTQEFWSVIFVGFGMDMSFPAAVIRLSAGYPDHQQGLAGSLVAVSVNYSLFLGLALAGTVEYYTTRNLPKSYESTVVGLRNAFRMGMGLAGFGVVLAIVFVGAQLREKKRKEKESPAQKV